MKVEDWTWNTPKNGGLTMRVEAIGNATLYLGDCREIELMQLADVALIADPPYGMNYNTDSTRFSGGRSDSIRRSQGSGRNDRFIEGDNAPFDPTPWLAFNEVILWGANHYANRLPTGSTLIWLKRYAAQYGTFLSDAEVGWQKGGYGVYAFHAPDSPGRRALDLGARNPRGAPTAHPFQKPIALMIWCIERTKGKTIFDPYMGSGTTGVAALKLGRRFVGIEKDPVYFETACRRVDAVARQPDMLTSSEITVDAGASSRG